MMSSNDPLKPVPGAELSPEPAKSPDSPECPDPIPLSEASPLKAGKKKKMPEVVDELKRQNARLTEENAKVEGASMLFHEASLDNSRRTLIDILLHPTSQPGSTT